MSKWMAVERLHKAQCELDDPRDHLDFAIELARKEGVEPNVVKVMGDALAKLDEIMGDLCWAQVRLRKR